MVEDEGKTVKVLLVTEFVMFVVSALLLLLLALLLYKAELSEAAVKTGVIVIYIITGMTGGILIGKRGRNESSYGDLQRELFILRSCLLFLWVLSREQGQNR